MAALRRASFKDENNPDMPGREGGPAERPDTAVPPSWVPDPTYGIFHSPDGGAAGDGGMASDAPRDNPTLGGGASHGGNAVMRKPSAPSPEAAGGPSVSMAPFNPMPSAPGSLLASSLGSTRRRGLMGAAGGQLEGGLGVPQDPTPNEADPLSALIASLVGKKGL